jgi:hypothetical protein
MVPLGWAGGALTWGSWITWPSRSPDRTWVLPSPTLPGWIAESLRRSCALVGLAASQGRGSRHLDGNLAVEGCAILGVHAVQPGGLELFGLVDGEDAGRARDPHAQIRRDRQQLSARGAQRAGYIADLCERFDQAEIA